jgi:hypothetical protein
MYIFSKETRKSEWKTQHENDQESKAAGSATATKLIKSCRGRRIDGQSPVEAKAAFYFGSVLALCNFVQDVESSPCGQGVLVFGHLDFRADYVDFQAWNIFVCSDAASGVDNAPVNLLLEICANAAVGQIVEETSEGAREEGVGD